MTKMQEYDNVQQLQRIISF